ncbi:hypothetical protein [Methylobacterium sp. J-076]|uniref:hypothetical protein n=1 Tax=Methylobacterium sp. J-076 TaxID=2836655 RepID=UPI001FBA5DB7|nr:hypothetical protein [Methylobacterium sp. J-076]MCJ2013986.1 hypothetical protein [Methylobacterium sp. J-076]
MNIVAENHADSFGHLGAQSQDALIAAAIGERLRDDYGQPGDETPEAILVLLRTLDQAGLDRHAIT